MLLPRVNTPSLGSADDHGGAMRIVDDAGASPLMGAVSHAGVVMPEIAALGGRGEDGGQGTETDADVSWREGVGCIARVLALSAAASQKK